MTPPEISILRGSPDDDELAALTLALLVVTMSAAERPPAEQQRRPGPAWLAPAVIRVSRGGSGPAIRPGWVTA